MHSARDPSAAARRIDAWMPDFDFSEFHRTRVRARPEVVFAALSEIDLAAHPVARALLGIRTLPARILGRAETPATVPALTLRNLGAAGFVLLEERPPHEIVLGVTGRFWQLQGGRMETDPATFREHVPAGAARVAWNFGLAAADDGTELSTETRIRCADARTRRTFGRYWRLIRPGSGWLRRIMLGMIRREAERRATA